MPQSTDLNVSPYFQDYDPNSQYMQILFQPGVSVQVRELNNLQAQLQNQIEQFGDNILQTGTVVSGCTFQFYPNYPYVKLQDLDLSKNTVVPSRLVGLFVESVSTALKAFVTNSADGSETTDPDFKTIFVTYLNGGFDGNTHIFNPGETLLVTDSNTSISSVNVLASGIQFSNSDFPVFTPALIVNVTSGTFANGDYVSQPSTGANLQVINIDTSTLALQGQTILYLTPRTVDLANSLVNANAWAVANNDTIVNAGNTALGSVVAVVGNSAAGSILTDGSGRVLEIPMAFGGMGYELLPTVTVRSVNNATGMALLNLKAQNFFSKILVANTSDAVGNGYAFGTGAGTIYQKGFFLRALPQTIVVDKYDTGPNNICVGFFSQESITTPEEDDTLFDNTQGTINTLSPGANRLKMVPTLRTADPNAAGKDFFQLVVWSEGNPVVVRQDTSYGELGRQLAQRTFESSGNFSLDQFNITTRSVNTASFEGNTFSLVVDPGLAYVEGYRVATERNFVISNRKGSDINAVANVSLSLNYGDWIPIANVGGTFQFSTGDTINLYDTAKGFLGNTTLVATGNINPTGNLIGTARIRSLVPATLPTAQPGDPNAQYYLYLFALNMSQGRNFRDVRAVQYGGVNQNANGIADVVLTHSSTLNANVCQFGNTLYDTMVFNTGFNIQQVNNATYTYRTLDQTLSFSNGGILSKTVTGNEYWPYANGTVLNQASLLQQYVVPIGGNIQAAANIAGTVSVNTTSNVMVGSSTTFGTDLVPGDWVYVYSNSTVHDVRRVMFVSNNTQLQLDANATITQSGCALYRYFPQYVPIPFGVRSGLTANVDTSGQVLTLSLGMALAGSLTCNTVLATDVQRIGASYGQKSAARDLWVVIQCSNVAGGTTGPWCLGVSDAIRLKQVARFTSVAPPYTNTQVNTLGHDVTGSFYIDQRQGQDYVDLSYLCLPPQSEITLTANDYLAVRFDAFQVATPGFFVQPSYVSSNMAFIQATDSLSLGNLASRISSFEVPMATNQKGSVYDLATNIDFRPIVANTATPTANVSLAPVNPANTVSFGNTAHPANDFKFPRPDSSFKMDLTSYIGRVDNVYLTHDTEIIVLNGQPGHPLGPNQPGNTMMLGSIVIPPYPNVPQFPSQVVAEVITTRTLNGNRRLQAHTLITPAAANNVFPDQPNRYTMADIQSLDRRVRNLEYYTGLSALQTDMVNKIIPSSVNPLIDRFKYGLQVDNFSSLAAQAINDPQYAASINFGMLTPPYVNWTIRHGAGQYLTSSYIDFKIVDQNIASVPNTAVIIIDHPLPNTTPNAVSWFLRVDADQVTTTLSTDRAPVVNRVDIETVTFANVAGTASFYWFVPATSASVSSETIVKLDPVQFYIFQGSTIIFTGYTNSTQLTGADITFLKSNAVPGSWFTTTELGTSISRTASSTSVSGSGKIVWTHNPKLGNVYTIEAVRVSDYDHWRYALSYPGAAPTIPAPQTLKSGAISYTGVIKAQPSTFLLALAPPATLTSEGGGISAAGSLLTKHYEIQELGGGMLGGGAGRIISDTTVTTVDFTALQQVWGRAPSGYGAASYYVTAGSVLQASIANHRNTQSQELYDMNGAATIYNTALLPQGFRLVIYGLKPQTRHFLKIAGYDQTATCRPLGGTLGAQLVTDDSGFLVFDYFYYGSGYSQPITTQLLSNTAPISVSAIQWLTGSEEVSVGDGTVTFEVSAPNSIAQYRMQVAASPEIPLNLLRHPGSVG